MRCGVGVARPDVAARMIAAQITEGEQRARIEDLRMMMRSLGCPVDEWDDDELIRRAVALCKAFVVAFRPIMAAMRQAVVNIAEWSNEVHAAAQRDLVQIGAAWQQAMRA